MGQLLWSRSPAEVVLDVAGGFFLAGGLVWNAWLRHETLCRGCGCPAHEQQEEGCGDVPGCEANPGTT